MEVEGAFWCRTAGCPWRTEGVSRSGPGACRGGVPSRTVSGECCVSSPVGRESTRGALLGQVLQTASSCPGFCQAGLVSGAGMSPRGSPSVARPRAGRCRVRSPAGWEVGRRPVAVLFLPPWRPPPPPSLPPCAAFGFSCACLLSHFQGLQLCFVERSPCHLVLTARPSWLLYVFALFFDFIAVSSTCFGVCVSFLSRWVS